MSTSLKTLQGKIEIPRKTDRVSDYKNTEIHLTSFYGGKERGKSLQIGFLNEDENYVHIQIDNSNVKELIIELVSNFL